MALLRRRLCSAPLTILGVVSIVFLLVHLIPGDPVEVMLGENAFSADRESLRQELGLDRPLWQQYTSFVFHALSGDLGKSFHTGDSVIEMIVARLPATLLLTFAGGLLAIVIALPLGTIAATRPGGTIDGLSTGFALLGASLPNFALAPILVLGFSIHLGWLPVSGMESFGSLVLPAVTLGLGMSAILTRLTRSALLEVLSADFIRTARAKGLPERSIILRHALRNSMIGVTTVFGVQIGNLLGGAIITETIYAWPGIGRLTLQAIESRDYPVVQGCVLVLAIGTLFANLAADIAIHWLDPRTREEEQ